MVCLHFSSGLRHHDLVVARNTSQNIGMVLTFCSCVAEWAHPFILVDVGISDVSGVGPFL